MKTNLASPQEVEWNTAILYLSIVKAESVKDDRYPKDVPLGEILKITITTRTCPTYKIKHMATVKGTRY